MPLLARDSGGRWFEEPIVDGFPLPRCPREFDRHSFESAAIGKLSAWQARTKSSIQSEQWLASRRKAIVENLDSIERQFGYKDSPLGRRVVSWAERQVPKNVEIVLTQSHGDFQEGNIMIQRADNEVLILDWEHSAERQAHYDMMVYDLKTRSPKGLCDRLRKFLDGQWAVRIPDDMVASLERRREILGMFLMEDLGWFLAESLSGPYTRVLHGLETYIAETNLALRSWSN